MWVHPEDRKLVREITSPDYIRSQLSSSKTYYTNYRTVENGTSRYLQLRMVNVGNKENISQVVMGYRNVDDEILHELKQNRILGDALNHAKSANIAKNTFLSNMSHDMRTPLNAIFGYTELAKKNAEDSSLTYGYLEKIETAGKQILDLIDKVLAASYSEAQDAIVNENECKVCDVVRYVYGRGVFAAYIRTVRA